MLTTVGLKRQQMRNEILSIIMAHTEEGPVSKRYISFVAWKELQRTSLPTPVKECKVICK